MYLSFASFLSSHYYVSFLSSHTLCFYFLRILYFLATCVCPFILWSAWGLSLHLTHQTIHYEVSILHISRHAYHVFCRFTHACLKTWSCIQISYENRPCIFGMLVHQRNVMACQFLSCTSISTFFAISILYDWSWAIKFLPFACCGDFILTYADVWSDLRHRGFVSDRRNHWIDDCSSLALFMACPIEQGALKFSYLSWLVLLQP